MRNAGLKYFGGVVGVIGVLGIAGTLFTYVWLDRSIAYVNFTNYYGQLAIFGSIAAVGILMYVFIDE